MAPCLALRGLVLSRGAIETLNLEFDAGVHLIVGPNGIGKTSLLNTLAGTLPPRAGTLLLDGEPLAARSASVVLAPNVPPDIPWIRARLLLDFVLSLYPATRVAPAETEATLERLGIAGVMDAPLGTLSAGTARKLLLAAALCARPPVLLFDEPTNEVDAASIAVFRELIGPLAASRVVLITTHHAGDLASVNPRVVALGPAVSSP